MEKKREITEREFVKAPLYWYKKYLWRADTDDSFWPDFRQCVPYAILGPKRGVKTVKHSMDENCRSRESMKATVNCYAQRGDKFYFCEHKPGQCPFLKYDKSVKR